MNENEKNLDEKVHKILVVDDEKDVLEALAETLQTAEEFKSEVSVVESGEAALDELEKKDFDLILTDYKMPNMNGVEFLSKTKDRFPGLIRMLITGFSDIDTAKEAINEAQVHNYIEKPWDNDEIIQTVYEALRRKNERESERIFGIAKVNDALQLVEEFQNDPLNFQLRENITEEKLMFEFNSINEFNKFSFELKKNKDVFIKDVNVFENKFIITVGINPKSFEEVLMYKD